MCPTEAIRRDESLGAVVISEEKCTGCRLCVMACPIEAIYFDEIDKKATKCDLCNGEPQCVKFCPTGALIYIFDTMGIKSGHPMERNEDA